MRTKVVLFFSFLLSSPFDLVHFKYNLYGTLLLTRVLILSHFLCLCLFIGQQSTKKLNIELRIAFNSPAQERRGRVHAEGGLKDIDTQLNLDRRLD